VVDFADCGFRFSQGPNPIGEEAAFTRGASPTESQQAARPAKTFGLVTRNRFEGLSDEGMYDEVKQDQDFPWLPTREQDRAFTWSPVCKQDRDVIRLPITHQRTPRNRKVQMHSQLYAHEVSPPEMNRSVNAQPYESSYFLPGKVAGKAATFLLDTGCTKNLLCRRLFDTFRTWDQVNLDPYGGNTAR